MLSEGFQVVLRRQLCFQVRRQIFLVSSLREVRTRLQASSREHLFNYVLSLKDPRWSAEKWDQFVCRNYKQVLSDRDFERLYNYQSGQPYYHDSIWAYLEPEL